MLVKLNILKTVRINRILQVLNGVFKLIYPFAMNLRVELLNKHRGNLLLELHLSTFKFNQISFKRTLNVTLEALHLAFH